MNMQIEKYNPNSLSVSAILGLIASGDIAIPEIQRPFVWKKKQVRDLLDSLYKGYPTGYLIIWKNPNVKLVLVGDGPDLDNYKKLSNSLGLDNHLIFTGKVSWEDVAIYYNMADIFTSASHTETQGLTVIEAMAASTPVVALNDESFRNVVIPDLNGYLFNSDNDYQKYMLSLINDKKKLDNFSKQARINSENYSSKYYAERVLKVYETAINNNGAGGKKTFFSRLKKVIKDGLHEK